MDKLLLLLLLPPVQLSVTSGSGAASGDVIELDIKDIDYTQSTVNPTFCEFSSLLSLPPILTVSISSLSLANDKGVQGTADELKDGVGSLQTFLR